MTTPTQDPFYLEKLVSSLESKAKEIEKGIPPEEYKELQGKLKEAETLLEEYEKAMNAPIENGDLLLYSSDQEEHFQKVLARLRGLKDELESLPTLPFDEVLRRFLESSSLLAKARSILDAKKIEISKLK